MQINTKTYIVNVTKKIVTIIGLIFVLVVNSSAQPEIHRNGPPDHAACKNTWDKHGRKIFILGIPDPVEQADQTILEETPDSLVPSAAEAVIPAYHSRPGALHKIYLDFDGHVTTGTMWNSYVNVTTIVTPPYDIDGIPSTFNATELANIEKIWRRVSEDYSPFNVDVTTEDPGLDALIKSGTGDNAWGIRVAIGGSNSDWLGQSAGGIAYIGSFNWNSDTPAFIFEAQLGNGNEKYVAEAVSHEVGHTLGLEHDGTSTQTYYAGYGSGETGWAPIMGNGYSKNHTTFDNGSYTDANNTQDDLLIISDGRNGFLYRTDDHGNTISSASPLTVNGNSVTSSGVIAGDNDVDVFSFSTLAGTISFNIASANLGPNLDSIVELKDASQRVLVSYDPTSSLSSSFSTMVDTGTYYLFVKSASRYGDIGQYFISGTIFGTGSQDISPPIAVLSSAPSVTAQGAIVYRFDVKYSDNNAIEVASIDSLDVKVITPNNISIPASLVGVDNNSNGAVRIATYQITPPGGSWDVNDNGSYSLVVNAAEVYDTSDNAAPAGALGSFSVNIDNTVYYTLSGTITLNGQGLGSVLVDGSFGSSQNTSSNGSYVFSNVSQGTSYSLIPQKTGYDFTPTSIGGITGDGKSTSGLNFTASCAEGYTLVSKRGSYKCASSTTSTKGRRK